jgi:(2Fe-2S) ferredoxin
VKKYRIVVCRGPECGDRRDSASLYTALSDLCRQRGLEGRVELGWQSCFGRCRQGPNVLVRPIMPNETRSLFGAMPLGGPGSALYNGVGPGDLLRILEQHVGRGEILRDKILRPEAAPILPTPGKGVAGGG